MKPSFVWSMLAASGKAFLLAQKPRNGCFCSHNLKLPKKEDKGSDAFKVQIWSRNRKDITIESGDDIWAKEQKTPEYSSRKETMSKICRSDVTLANLYLENSYINAVSRDSHIVPYLKFCALTLILLRRTKRPQPTDSHYLIPREAMQSSIFPLRS